jgi:hypothetical protein
MVATFVALDCLGRFRGPGLFWGCAPFIMAFQHLLLILQQKG